MTEIAKQFADAYREGAHGAMLDADSAKAVAISIDELVADLNELEQLFDLRHSADQRAIKRWQDAHPGKENIWPDHVELIIWLLEQIK